MIYLTSDEHMMHLNIIRYSSRPFSTVEEMNNEIIRRFNERVGANDITYHVGDFSLQEKYVQPYLSRENGEHVLIRGNHDQCHPKHKKHEEATERYLTHGFKAVHDELEVEEFLLAHMPYADPTAKDQRYQQYRPVRRGDKVLLHGHVHNTFKFKANPPQLNVGVDAWNYYPVSILEIRAFIATNPGDTPCPTN
jgi:calcineurin-like phosphoesterase family protein